MLVTTNDQGAKILLFVFAIGTLSPKISVLALKTHKGQTLAELDPVKSNMLFRRAVRGKGEQCDGGRRKVWKVLCCSVVPGEL